MSALGTVLIVEDDDSTRFLLQAIVTRNRLQPIIAVDGRSAQALLAISVFDAILLDLRLPEIDGGTLLRGLDRPMLRRVMIITAAPQTEWRTHLDAGVWCVIQKPFDVGQLEESLLACLAGDGAAGRNAGDQGAERTH